MADTDELNVGKKNSQYIDTTHTVYWSTSKRSVMIFKTVIHHALSAIGLATSQSL